MPIAHGLGSAAGEDPVLPAVIGERLTLAAFHQLSGNLSGYPFLKLVMDRPRRQIHFINNSAYPFHADYIGDQILRIPREELEAAIDSYNNRFYCDPEREYCLGILSLHRRRDRSFFCLETVEVDMMDGAMLSDFFKFVRESVDQSLPLLLKPANHLQESYVTQIDPAALPRVFAHELFSTATFIPLNPGKARGRLRLFRTHSAYEDARSSLEWHDIVAMGKVPDDIPRVAGIINAEHTTPLSHTNVLASGWQIPNCIQIGALDRLEAQDGQWVDLEVLAQGTEARIVPAERPADVDHRPAWKSQKIRIEEPQVTRTPIVQLGELRMEDRYKYGTKAANLGELCHLVENGSERLLGFYRIRRPPRANLLPYLARLLGVPESADLGRTAWEFLRDEVKIPTGIAIPFSVQQEALETSPKIQQAIGKLKMAIELNARQVDALCVTLQQMIRSMRIPEKVRSYIDSQVANVLGGVSSFVVRSSSNAEDLEGFSAAGIYESINHVTKADTLFESIKQVWASLLSPRSVRLRQEVGISLDDCYMGVIVQEEAPCSMGGVMVTSNPMNRGDFRNVYLNVSVRSVTQIVQGNELPFQYLYNTVEGGGRTLSLGQATEDLPETEKGRLQKLALAGRLLQSHFSPDYTFSTPLDVEWLADERDLKILQIRPYAR